ncbi:Mss4-like protein, partial [Rhizophagus irregularis]|uniref:Mss4-like protein n=2 Tax=Rhizophagus irregularis TaxID=588596 RepID=U9SR72_RHIID|eukprot:XP_025172738.1 hypothetical protein GLOIN_2v1662470 [Rhizophagus irregularis DAOM 181602=DAOM 197198]
MAEFFDDINSPFFDDKNGPGVPFKEFTDPQNQLVNSENHNAYSIYCGQGCRSLILRANLGKWVERSKEKLKLPDENEKDTKESDSENSSENSSSENSSSDDVTLNQGFWVLNDVMAFENINVTNTIVTGIRYLCCPRCNNINPLGYNDTNTKMNEYLIAADRVSYLREE